MVDASGQVKVLDFGIARAAESPGLTRTAYVLGSASYLAPELAKGEPAEARSDIYALGCVLYELLAGRAPFTGEHPAAILHQHLKVAPPPLRDVPGITVPSALEALVMAMLAKEPANRPASVAELETALPSALEEETVPLGERTVPLGERTVPLGERTVPLGERTRTTRPLNAVPLVGAGAAAAAGLSARSAPAQGARATGSRLGPAERVVLALAAVLVIAGVAAVAFGGGSGSASSRTVARSHSATDRARRRTTTTTASTTATESTTTGETPVDTTPVQTNPATTTAAVAAPAAPPGQAGKPSPKKPGKGGPPGAPAKAGKHNGGPKPGHGPGH
jgi:serine/threonine-protein kinase